MNVITDLVIRMANAKILLAHFHAHVTLDILEMDLLVKVEFFYTETCTDEFYVHLLISHLLHIMQ